MQNIHGIEFNRPIELFFSFRSGDFLGIALIRVNLVETWAIGLLLVVVVVTLIHMHNCLVWTCINLEIIVLLWQFFLEIISQVFVLSEGTTGRVHLVESLLFLFVGSLLHHFVLGWTCSIWSFFMNLAQMVVLIRVRQECIFLFLNRNGTKLIFALCLFGGSESACFTFFGN